MAHHRLARLRSKFHLGHMAANTREMLEVGAGAWLTGVVEGRLGGPETNGMPKWLGVPAPIAIAAGLKVLAYLDVAGAEYSGDLDNLATGALAAWTSSHGFNFGANWKKTGQLFGGMKASGELAAGEYVAGSISEKQMNEIVARLQAAQSATP